MVVKKDEAKVAINKAAEAKKRKSIKHLMRQMKRRQRKAKVDEAVTTAKNAIDQATNNAGVDTAKTNGVDSINNVQPTVVKKDEAKTAIENAARAKKRKSIKRLMRQMKKRWRKAKVDEAVNNAKASIDQVTNNEGVDTAKSNGLDSITISNQRLLRKTKQNSD